MYKAILLTFSIVVAFYAGQAMAADATVKDKPACPASQSRYDRKTNPNERKKQLEACAKEAAAKKAPVTTDKKKSI